MIKAAKHWLCVGGQQVRPLFYSIQESIRTMLFDRYGLIPALQHNLEAAGYRRPTDIQFRAIPPILNGNDLLAIAQTGTGKTLAYAVPAIEILARTKRSQYSYSPRCVVLVPTHELAQQVHAVFEKLCANTGLLNVCVIGGYEVEEQAKGIDGNVDIVVATPGRLRDLGRNQILDLRDVKYLVLDEADRMLSLGFRPDIDQLLRYRLVVNPIRIEIAPDDPVSRNIRHSLVEVQMDDKRFFLERLVRGHAGEKVIAFVRTQVRADRVRAAMERAEIQSLVLHGGMDRQAREDTLAAFAQGDVKLLITTDVAARGLDIPEVAIVVNYDMPTQPEIYVHRIGRTGRWTNRGLAVSFCAPEENKQREAIERLLGHFIPVVEVKSAEYAETVDFSIAADSDWKTLLRKHNEAEAEREAKKRRAKRKK